MTRQGGWRSTGFSESLKRLRKEVGLTQARLAELADVHTMTISHLERGKYEPAWPLVLALAKALGKRPNDFEVEEAAPKKRGNK